MISKLLKKGRKAKIKHPTYIFLEKGNVYTYVSITHSKSVEGAIVVKLRKNPNPKDNRESYRVVSIKEDTKDRFGSKKRWSIDSEDEKDIREEYKKR